MQIEINQPFDQFLISDFNSLDAGDWISFNISANARIFERYFNYTYFDQTNYNILNYFEFDLKITSQNHVYMQTLYTAYEKIEDVDRLDLVSLEAQSGMTGSKNATIKFKFIAKSKIANQYVSFIFPYILNVSNS